MLLTLGLIISLIQITSYVYTALINPGLPKHEYEKMIVYDINIRKCKDCGMFINLKELTFHCYECGVCIEGYDHHCPWTSKCIGKGNIISFYIFIISTLILFGYLIFSTTLISN